MVLGNSGTGGRSSSSIHFSNMTVLIVGLSVRAFNITLGEATNPIPALWMRQVYQFNDVAFLSQFCFNDYNDSSPTALLTWSFAQHHVHDHCCVHRCIWSTVRLGGCPGTQQGLPTGLSIQKALLRIVVEDAATLSWMLARPGSFSSASWSPHTSFTERPCKLGSIAAKFLKFIHSLPSPTALVTQKSTARN